MVKMVDLNDYEDHLVDFSKRDFNIMSFSEKVDRKYILPILMINGIN